VRLARVLTRLNLGGPARQALGCDPLLAREGVELRVFCGRPEIGEGDLFDEFRARGVDVVRVPGLGRAPTGVGDLRALQGLRRELRAFQPDLVHTHASKAGLLGRLAARGLKNLRGQPVVRVHTFHGHVLEGYFSSLTSRALVALERGLARGTDRVLAVSHATAKDLLRLGVAREDQLVVVPPGVELGPLLELRAVPGVVQGPLRDLIGAVQGDFVVGVLGRLAEVKCPERAVDVFRMLAGRHPHLHLCFVGDGDQRRLLERRIRELPGSERRRVHLVGAHEDMVAVLGELDCVLSSSRSEGMPVALMEAGAAGLPVVATDVGGVCEVVAHERTGLLGEDTDELAYGLDRLLTEPGLAGSMGRRARVRVAEKHSAAALAGRLSAVYSASLEERRCAC
jgi:glycosyltransferase involved in cell wall biosynthesis